MANLDDIDDDWVIFASPGGDLTYSSEVVAILEPEGDWSTAHEAEGMRHLVEVEFAKQVVRYRRQRAHCRPWPGRHRWA